MSVAENCQVCGKKRPVDGPAGLCPACLLKAGLAAKDSKLDDVTFLFGPASSSIVAAFGEAFGKMPRVLLRDADSLIDPGPVIRPSSDEIPNPAKRSARLQLFGEIARGGMGAVLKGRDADLGRELAVKILLESHRDKPEMVRRFIEEAQIAGQLQHPGIVPVYELGAFGDHRPYFAMKLVKGQTLAEILANRKSLSDGLPKLLSIFESICQTMAYAHARGVIHRDLKPSNVMVGSFGEVQVMDWGLAKVLPRGGVVDDASAGHTKEQATLISTARSGTDSDLSQAGSVMGTPAYMAPEQARGEVEELDERADVFALGSIFCELLTGQPAFNGRNSGEILRKAARGDLAEAVTRLDRLDQGHDPELVALAKSCLSSERDDRPRHAGEIAERMSLYHSRVQDRLRQSEIERAEQKARAEEATKRATVERQRLRLTVALAASLLMLISVGGLTSFHFYQQRQAGLISLETTVARIETLREQAVSEGAESPIRREAIVSTDIALASLGSLTNSAPGQRLADLRNELTQQQERAERGEQLLAEIDRIRPRRSERLETWEPVAERQFREAFRKFGADLDTDSSTEIIDTFKLLPASIVRGLVSNLDRWLVFRHDHVSNANAQSVDKTLQRVLELLQSMDPDDERNRLRAFLTASDLSPLLPDLLQTANGSALLESGPEKPLLLARLLNRAGDSTTSLSILRKSALRYPGDLWTNLELANQSERPADALRYFTAARALEPQMGFCLSEMFECGMYKSEGSTLVREELARIDPDNLDNLLSLIIRLKDDKRIEYTKLTHDYLRAAILRNPQDAMLHGKLAVSSLITRDHTLTITSLREVARLEPWDGECRYWLGLLLRHEGQLLDAVRELREAIRLAPSNINYHDALAVALRDINDRDAEIAELREGIRLDALERNQVNSNPSRNVHEQSQSTISQIMQSFGMMTEAYIDGTLAGLDGYLGSQRYESLSEALVETGDIRGGIEALRNAIALDPEETIHRVRLVTLLRSHNQTEAAELEEVELVKHHRTVLESKPGDATTAVQLALLLEQRGKVDEAIVVFRTTIEGQPDSSDLRTNLADLLERHSKLVECDAELDQVIDLLRKQIQANEDVNIVQQLGMFLLRRGKRDEARHQFRRVVELAKDPASTGNSLAWDLSTHPNARLRDGELAVEYASRACELTDWKNFMFLDTLAAASAEKGDFDAAIKWQTKAIEYSSGSKQEDAILSRLKLYEAKQPFHQKPAID